MAEYLNATITEYYNGSEWVDITQYVVGDIKGNNGLGGWRPESRVAVLGTLNITINNKSKQFSPMGGDAARGLFTLTGWNKGAKIRVRGEYQGRNDVLWTGRIASIDSDDLNWGNEQVRVMATDWMNVPVNYPMKGATIALNKRIDEAMTSLLSRLSVQPDDTDFDTGVFTFPAVFDNVQRKTMALSEFTKLANSELGYIYIKQDGTLKVENMLARHGWRELDQLWVEQEEESFLLLEDGNFLLLEDGGKFVLESGRYVDAEISEDAEGYNILLPEDGILNASIIRAHPVITDTSLKVLYKLGTPLFIPSGRTVTFSAHYTDPNGLSQVSGTNMQSPVATTDYLANAAANGSGTNYTANVSVSATYYGDTVYYSIVNNAVTGVYITFLQARGYGIYYGNSIESTKEDTVSQSAYGYFPFQFDQKYQKDSYLANMYGNSVIEEYKNPKSRTTTMKYLANLNKNHMMSFLVLTIGSLILGTEDRSNLSNYYYITDRAFTIKQGGIIHVEYGVKQNDSYLSGGLEPVTVEFGGNGSGDSINYGDVPQALNHTQRTISMWVYRNALGATSTAQVMFGGLSDKSGIAIYTKENYSQIEFQVKTSGQQGVWETANGLLTAGAWHHVLYTFNSATLTPVCYLNAVSRTITEALGITGTFNDETGINLVIGNENTVVYPNTLAFDGKIFDVRIYNRILTAAEVTTLYNAGVPDHTLVTDGLVFQGPATYADNPLSAGHVLTSSDRLTENIIRAVGVPNGSPVIRANP